MKKLTLVLLAVSSFFSAFAQPQTILVYGNFSVSTDNQQYSGSTINSSQWFINPGVGYQLDKRWTVGIQGTYGQSMGPNYAFSTDQTLTTTDWTAGVFVRYTRYFGNIFSVYGQVDLGNAQGTVHMEDNGSGATLADASYVGFRGNLFPALGLTVCKGLALNFNVGGISYASYSWTDHPSGLQTENKLNIDFGHTLTIGVSKNFATQKTVHGHHEPGEDTRHMNTKDDDDEPKAHKEGKKHHHGKGKKNDKTPKSKKTSDDDDE